VRNAFCSVGTSLPRSCRINHSRVTTIRSLPANCMSGPNPVVLVAVRDGLCAQRDGIYVHPPMDHIQSLCRAGHVTRKGGSKGAYRVLVGNYEGKRPFGRRGRRCEDNNKMHLQEVGW
jgi:hypothetical protein